MKAALWVGFLASIVGFWLAFTTVWAMLLFLSLALVCHVWLATLETRP